MTPLRVDQSELTYEGSFVKPVLSLIDSPGRVSEFLLESLAAFGVSSADLFSEDGEPGDRGITCEVDDLDARVTVRGDRLEFHCSHFVPSKAEKS